MTFTERMAGHYRGQHHWTGLARTRFTSTRRVNARGVHHRRRPFQPDRQASRFSKPDGPHSETSEHRYPAAGKLRFEFMLAGATIRGTNAMLDADGAAIVIHGSRDNYHTDPTGDSGARIACGVIVLK